MHTLCWAHRLISGRSDCRLARGIARQARLSLGFSVLCLLSVSLFAVTCGGGGNPNGPMLSARDIGSGWKEQPYTHVKEAGLCGQDEPAAFDGTQEGATAVWLDSSDGVSTLQEVLFRQDRAAAEAMLGELRRQASLCREFDATESKITTHHVLSELSAPEVGDDRFAFREITSDVPVAGRVYTNYAAVVLGDSLVFVRLSSLNSDDPGWQAIVLKAVSRAARASSG